MRPDAGVTLVELLVVLVVIGFMLSVSTMAMPRAEVRVVDTDQRVAVAQLEASRSGVPARVQDDSGRALLVLPDGEVLGPGFDPLTGGRRAVR